MTAGGRVLAAIGLFGALGELACGSSEAGIVINEVMANEPGGSVTLEWIELYNDETAAVSVQDYRLAVGDKSIALPDSVWLQAGEYYLICRKLLSDSSSPGFEQRWGDNSGVWGDAPEESGLQTPLTASFGLSNGTGTVQLYSPAGWLMSELTWNQSGKDGFSWERKSPGSAEIEQSVDPDGSTPGFINSLTPVSNDLALEEVGVASEEGETSLAFVVTNRGLNTVPGAWLFLCRDSDENGEVPVDTVDVMDIADLEPGAVFAATRRYFFDGLYVNPNASLTDDDRLRNNVRDFVAPGGDFPPIVVSELMANPQRPLETEWVEIRCRFDQAIDITGWKLGDSMALHTIAETSLVMEPDEYVILAKDGQAFLDFYSGFDGVCLQPAHWPAFNNGADVVVLVDSLGFEGDRFAYAEVFNDNYTWGRCDEVGCRDDWGRSEQAGGSPGQANRVLFEPTGAVIAVTVQPNVFSPDGDDLEDSVVITVDEAPAEAELTMRIYDRQGRAVRSLVEAEKMLRAEYTWDGRSDAGNRLPVGIYILYVEATGGRSVKKPVVIAR